MRPSPFDLWMLPLELSRFWAAWAQMSIDSASIISKRLPMIADGIASPMTADYRELNLMVTEKVRAGAVSGSTANRSARRLSRNMEMQAKALGRIVGGQMAMPWDLWQVAERQMTIIADAVHMPGEVAAPYFKAVKKNEKRLNSK